MNNRVKIVVGLVGFLLLISTHVRSSAINGDPKKLFGTGSAQNRNSIALDDCHERKYIHNGKNFLATNRCWRVCEALLPEGTAWPDIIQKYGQGQGDASSLWDPATTSFIQLRMDQTDQHIKSRETGEEFKRLIGLLYQCHALITVSGHSDYSDDKLLPGAGSGRHIRKSLINPQLKCIATGYDTQDYSKCVRMIKLYDTFTYAKKAKETIDIVRYDDHVADQHYKLVKKRTQGDTVGAKDSIDVQKESFKKQKDISAENMTISAAQTASLVAIVNSMPTLKSLLQDECLPGMKGKEREFQKLYEAGKQMAQSAPPSRQPPNNLFQWSGDVNLLEPDPLCANIVKMNINLILNAEARNMGIMLGTRSGIDAVTNLARGAILKKRIKGLDGAIKKIDEFTAESLTEEELEDIYLQECVLKPDLPKCKIRQRRSVDGVNNSYSFGTNTSSTILGDNTGDGNGTPSENAPNVDRSNLPAGVGIPLPDVKSLGNNDFSGSIPPGASYAAGKGAGNPGGGNSGGGPGNVSPPGKSVGGERSERSPAAAPPPKVKYDGSGGGWKGYNSGGKGRSRLKSQNQTGNPFAKLFGKNRGKGSRSELVEFRNPASKPHASDNNIFQRLSRRYRKVDKKKLLLEYSIEDSD